MSFFDKAKDLYKVQKQAKDIKKKLANIVIEAEVDGLIVRISGEQEVKEVKIMDENLLTNKTKLEKAIMEASNKAMKKSQQVAADNMKDIMGSLGLGM